MSRNDYNITLVDQSPTVTYSPSRDGPLDSSWHTFYSNSPDSSYDDTHTDENLSSGTSLHSTTLNGASFQIDFKGTAIFLHGAGSQGAYTTSIDSVESSGTPSDGILASYTDLEYAVHTVILTTTSNSQLNFSSAVLTVAMGEEGDSIKQTKISAVNVESDGSSSLNESYFTTSGNGPFSTDHDAIGYPRIDTTGDNSKIMFSFNSACALFVYGTANYDHDEYSVSISPSAGASTSTRTFNDTSQWFAYDIPVYWETDLDRDTTYEVTFTNLAEGKYMDIHSVTLYDAQSSDSGLTTTSSNPLPTGDTDTDSASGKLATGAIAGIAVVAILALIGGIAFLLWWRKHLQKKNKIDLVYDGTSMTPFNDGGFMTPFPAHSQPLLSGYVEPFVLPASTEASFTGMPVASKFNSLRATSFSRDAPVMAGAAPYASKYDSLRSMPYSDSPAQRLSYHLTLDGFHAMSEAGSSGTGSNSSGVAGAVVGRPRGASPGKEASLDTRVRPVRQETDAGPLPESEHIEEDVLPPGYNPEWVAGGSR